MEQTMAPAGRGKAPLRLLAVAVVIGLVALAGVLVAVHNNVARAALRSVGHGFGYDIAAQTVDINLGTAVLGQVRIANAHGEPVFEARRVVVGYSPRDLLPGGTRLFGLKSVEVEAPRVTVIHHADGTYNITPPPSSQSAAKPVTAPLDVELHVSNGSIDLIDRFVAAPRERRERIVELAAAGAISPKTPSLYHARAVLVDAGRRYPIIGIGRFADARGFELQHVTAARLPIAALANFVLSTHALTVQSGRLEQLDIKLGALANSAGTMQSHFGISSRLVDGRLAVAALAKPIRDARASIVVDDDSATVRGLDASLDGLPLQVRGAVYHFAAPQVAFAVTARGDLARVRELSKDIAHLPIRGAIVLQGLAEGPAANPLIFARFRSPAVNYGDYRFDRTHGFVAVSGQEVDLLSASVRYGAVDLAARGALQLQRHTQTAGYALVRAPADSLPYVDNIVPGLALTGTAVVRGSDGKLAAHGYVGGSGAGTSLDLPFAYGVNGSGTLGPLAVVRRDGASVYARAALDRGTNRTVAIVDAHALSLLPAPAVVFPGLNVPPMPPKLDAKLDATLAVSALGTALTAANGALHAYGSWGDLRAEALGAGSRFAARGRLTSSFDRLARFTGNIGARGDIDVPFALNNDGRSTVMQITHARFANGAVRGIPLTGANATFAIDPKMTITIYSADLQLAGRDVTAQGRWGNGGQLHVTAGDVDLATLRAAGIPLANGRATVIADLGGTPSRPLATVLAAFGGARYAGTAVAGDIGVAYDGAALHLNRATVTYGGAYANAEGTISGLALGHIAPRYAVRAQLEDADIATLARTVKNPLRYPEGTIDADVRVGGAGALPAFAGALRVPEGSINGLNFRAGRIGFNGTPAALRADGGQLTFGSTTLHFSAGASRAEQSVALASRRLDLADFNDYFDEAEVLAGSGSVALSFDAAAAGLHTSADLSLGGVRYRRFVLGNARATVRTAGSAIRLQGSLAGQNGRAALTGSILVPGSDPLRDIARRSYVDLSGQITALNLGNVLPAAGVNAPVIGFLDGSAVVRGRYPALALSTHAELINGVAGRLPIERFRLAATAANGHGRLTDLSIIAPGLAANVSGTFGLRPEDAFNLNAHVASADIRTLTTAATGKNPGVKGSLETRAHLSGTLNRPRIGASIDINSLSYNTIIIPKAHVDIDATRQALTLRNGNIALPRGGTIAFDGHAPLSAGATTPIAFNFVPHNVNVNPYSSLLPDGSVLQGVFEGNVALRGTLAAPQLGGGLSFANGSYRSNSLKAPLTAIALQLDFAGTGVQISKLHVHAGSGNIDGSGSIGLGDLRNPLPDLRANINLMASNALLSLPKLYVGYIDGTVSLTKAVRSPLSVGGDLTFSSARIPYTALIPSGGTATTAAPVLPDVNLALGVTLGRDVRIQSGPVDIGATGVAQLGGTLSKPTLDGQFNATDGTVSVYRTFVVQNGSAVTFSAADGLTPSVDATAVTHISDPATDILLHITGLSTHLNLAFSSEPAYNQQQILGLLVNAQALGAVSGVAQSSGSSSSSGSAVTGIGEGLLNTQFTQKFLQPFSSKVGGALGLSDLNVNYSLNGAVSASARHSLGKNISFTYGEQIGGPTPRTSVGINIGTSVSGAQLTFFQAAGSSKAFGGQALTPYLQSGFLATSSPNYTLQAIEPPSGSGFVFSYQRHF